MKKLLTLFFSGLLFISADTLYTAGNNVLFTHTSEDFDLATLNMPTDSILQNLEKNGQIVYLKEGIPVEIIEEFGDKLKVKVVGNNKNYWTTRDGLK